MVWYSTCVNNTTNITTILLTSLSFDSLSKVAENSNVVMLHRHLYFTTVLAAVITSSTLSIWLTSFFFVLCVCAVSYTHLDVYKRQSQNWELALLVQLRDSDNYLKPTLYLSYVRKKRIEFVVIYIVPVTDNNSFFN